MQTYRPNSTTHSPFPLHGFSSDGKQTTAAHEKGNIFKNSLIIMWLSFVLILIFQEYCGNKTLWTHHFEILNLTTYIQIITVSAYFTKCVDMKEFLMYTKRELISFILNAYIIARQLKNIKIICKIMGYINRHTNS